MNVVRVNMEVYREATSRLLTSLKCIEDIARNNSWILSERYLGDIDYRIVVKECNGAFRIGYAHRYNGNITTVTLHHLADLLEAISTICSMNDYKYMFNNDTRYVLGEDTATQFKDMVVKWIQELAGMYSK